MTQTEALNIWNNAFNEFVDAWKLYRYRQDDAYEDWDTYDDYVRNTDIDIDDATYVIEYMLGSESDHINNLLNTKLVKELKVQHIQTIGGPDKGSRYEHIYSADIEGKRWYFSIRGTYDSWEGSRFDDIEYHVVYPHIVESLDWGEEFQSVERTEGILDQFKIKRNSVSSD